MKFLIQKYLLKKPLLILPLILISLAIIQFKSQYKVIYEEFKPHTSSNPPAVEEFVKAVHYDVYIERLHLFINYDNPIMIPFFKLRDYYFQKAQALTPDNDGMDVFFWVLINKNKVFPDKDGDHSMAYSNFSPNEYKKINEMLYKYTIKYLTYNDFKFTMQNFNYHKLNTSYRLMYYYVGLFYRQHNGTKKEKITQLYTSDKYFRAMQELYVLYKLFYKKHKDNVEKSLTQSQKTEQRFDYVYMENLLISGIDYIKLKKTHVNQMYCNSSFLKNMQKIYQFKITHFENIYIYNHALGIFNTSINRYLTKTIYNTCPNLRQEAKQILNHFKEINNGK